MSNGEIILPGFSKQEGTTQGMIFVPDENNRMIAVPIEDMWEFESDVMKYKAEDYEIGEQ